MKFSTSIKVGKHEVFIEDEANDLKDMWMKLDSLHTIPDQGPNGEQDLYFSHRKAKDKFDYFTIICPSAGKQFAFGQKMNDGSLFPKGWEPIQHKLSGLYPVYDERTGDHEQDYEQEADPAPRPRPLTTDRRDQYKAAMQAQAPAGKIIHPACPAKIDADEWDARCAAIEEAIPVLNRWNLAVARNWLTDQTSVADFRYPEELYKLPSAALRQLVIDAKAEAVTRPAAQPTRTPEQEFNLLCVQNGLAKQAAGIKEKHKKNGKCDFAAATAEVKQILSNGVAAKA